MAVDERTLRLIDSMRVQVARTVDAEVEQLTLAWVRAWNELQREWTSALAVLVADSADGRWPSRAQILRAQAVREALDTTEAALDGLVADHQVRILRALPEVTAAAAEWSRALTASQYPPSAGTVAQVAAGLPTAGERALRAIVERTAGQVNALTKPLSMQATAAMKSTLIRGVALGRNPNTVAGDMLRRVRGDFDGGLVRAKVIARTEMLSAHRSAAHAQDKADADLLQGWQWVCALDRRTCPACLAKHGTVHPVDEEGPDDHQQGRCARVPLLKPWKELGFDVEEPPSLIPSARDWFDGLPSEDQESIMGRRRLDLLKSGAVGWDDLAVKRTTVGWRDSWAPRPARDLAKLAAAQ